MKKPSSPGVPASLPGGSDSLSLPFAAELGLVEGILPLVDEWAAGRGAFKDDRISLRIVLEELLLNICFHAGGNPADEAPKVDLTITAVRAADSRGDEAARPVQRLLITVRDTGREFNPLLYEEKPAESISQASPGGRGLTLVRLLAAELHYARKHGHNILTLALACAGHGQPVGASVPAACSAPWPACGTA